MHTTIKRVIKEECIGKVWITTIEFEDGGEVMRASGVGKGYTPRTPIVVYMDDRYNRLKFTADTYRAKLEPYGQHTSQQREPLTETN